ncbi:MAG: hypothetical protein IKR51_02085 [Oscillospiraceae bacterium]|nr:hypothetical protein [Oscillospiraceae bacterium]
MDVFIEAISIILGIIIIASLVLMLISLCCMLMTFFGFLKLKHHGLIVSGVIEASHNDGNNSLCHTLSVNYQGEVRHFKMYESIKNGKATFSPGNCIDLYYRPDANIVDSCENVKADLRLFPKLLLVSLGVAIICGVLYLILK